MMWLMDHVFKYTNFGLVSLIHGDFFIRQASPDYYAMNSYMNVNINRVVKLACLVSFTGQST